MFRVRSFACGSAVAAAAPVPKALARIATACVTRERCPCNGPADLPCWCSYLGMRGLAPALEMVRA